MGLRRRKLRGMMMTKKGRGESQREIKGNIYFLEIKTNFVLSFLVSFLCPFFVFPSFYFYLSFLIRPTISLKSLPSSTCRPFNSFRHPHLQELRRRLGVLEKALKQQVQAEVGRHRATAKKLYSLQLEHHKLEEQLKVGNLSPSLSRRNGRSLSLTLQSLVFNICTCSPAQRPYRTSSVNFCLSV